MAFTATPVYAQSLYQNVQTLTNADGQTVKAVTVSQTNSLRIYSIIVSSSDTAARDIILYLTISATNYPLIQVSIPITAGQVNTTPPINLLKGGVTPGSFPGLCIDSNGNPYIDLPTGSTLSVNAPVTVTTAKQINIIATGENY